MLNDMSAVRDLPYGTHLCSTECMKKLKKHTLRLIVSKVL